MTAYRFHEAGAEPIDLESDEALARFILHNQRILRDEYRIMPKPEAVRLEVEGKVR